jgi:hypothetical protein
LVTGRTIALFIHLLGVVTLFTATGIVHRAGARVRAASSVEELRLWLGLARSTSGMFPASLVLILGSGLYMTHLGWSFGAPWVVTAIVSIVVIGALGGGVVGRSFASIARATPSSGPITPDLARIIARPTPWVAAAAFNGMAIGMLWLMVTKPGWTQSIGVTVALGIVGSVIGYAVVRAGTKDRKATGSSPRGLTGVEQQAR